MSATLTASEEAQLSQTIEIFEVITQSQPQDYQSLEILKEAYFKLNREKDVIGTSKRIAQAYVGLGQLSSAILEYETILQRFPDDSDVQAALKDAASRIRAAGKAAGILTGALDDVEPLFELGYNFVAVGSDVGLLARTAEQVAARFKRS